jgi:predicted XRE-type DNA-binding protein
MAKEQGKQDRVRERPDTAQAELVAIKKLLVLGLIRSGTSQRQIAKALGVNQSQISRLFPGGIDLPKKDQK